MEVQKYRNGKGESQSRNTLTHKIGNIEIGKRGKSVMKPQTHSTRKLHSNEENNEMGK